VTVAVGDGVGLGIGLSGAVVASGVGGVVGAGKGWALQGRVEGCSAGFLIRILPESYSMV
jgi:hypothetical protein